MKSKSFVRGSAALLATLTLMSGKLSAMQPTMSQPVMIQPMMYPAQQLNVKEQMMLQNNAADNQIALQNNSTDNKIREQDNLYKNMKDYRDSDPSLKWVFYTFVGTAVATLADFGAGAYATGNPWWLFEGYDENVKAAQTNGCEKMYNVADNVASIVGSVWMGFLCFLKITADLTSKLNVYVIR